MHLRLIQMELVQYAYDPPMIMSDLLHHTRESQERGASLTNL